MDADEAEAITAESRRLLALTSDLPDYKPPEVDALEAWVALRVSERRHRGRQPRRVSEVTDHADWKHWNNWCDARIAAALERDARLRRDVLAHLVVTLRKEWRQKVDEEVSKLRAELQVVRPRSGHSAHSTHQWRTAVVTRLSPEARDLLRHSHVITLRWIAEEAAEEKQKMARSNRRRLLQRVAAQLRLDRRT
jgi:hypothetical protein